MRRAKGFYFGFLLAASSLIGVAALLTLAADEVDWQIGMIRFVVLGAAAASAAGAWVSAATLASVYKVTWPLILSVGIVLCAGLTFAIASTHGASPRM
jgi:hypothetical protein